MLALAAARKFLPSDAWPMHNVSFEMHEEDDEVEEKDKNGWKN